MDKVSTHSRLKAAGTLTVKDGDDLGVSTHSRLKAAGGGWQGRPQRPLAVSTHSRLKAAGLIERAEYQRFGVSTHSRLKAAGVWALVAIIGFIGWFQHTAA